MKQNTQQKRIKIMICFVFLFHSPLPYTLYCGFSRQKAQEKWKKSQNNQKSLVF
jgi:hypothetical protein